MLTRRYFEVFAKILGETRANHRIIKQFIEFFEYDNPNFDEDRFREAVALARGLFL